jgi:drug/metabolite transporter (DMT)-like permease
MSFVLGVISALTAPFLVVVGFIVWDNHWNGTAFALNMYNCTMTAIGFLIVSIVVRQFVLEPSTEEEIFTSQKIGGLMVSSTIGILIGDWVWLEGLRLLGSRKIIVVDSLKPFLAVFLGEVFLDERLERGAIIGLILTVLGVALVGLEKEDHNIETETTIECESVGAAGKEVFNERTVLIEKDKNEQSSTVVVVDSYAQQRKNRGKQSTKEFIYGLVMAILNVVLHTFGVLLTKKYGVGMTTFEINLIRFGFAGICMALLSFSLWSISNISSTTTSTTTTMTMTTMMTTMTTKPAWYLLPDASYSTWRRISFGVVFVSFLQPALTNYAMFQISLALLLTLESIGPLYSLPLSYILQGDRPTFRACVGAILAVIGIIVLSFKGITES